MLKPLFGVEAVITRTNRDTVSMRILVWLMNAVEKSTASTLRKSSQDFQVPRPQKETATARQILPSASKHQRYKTTRKSATMIVNVPHTHFWCCSIPKHTQTITVSQSWRGCWGQGSWEKQIVKIAAAKTAKTQASRPVASGQKLPMSRDAPLHTRFGAGWAARVLVP